MREFSPHGLLCSLKLACTCVPAAQHICQPYPGCSYFSPCSRLMGCCPIIHDYRHTHISVFFSAALLQPAPHQHQFMSIVSICKIVYSMLPYLLKVCVGSRHRWRHYVSRLSIHPSRSCVRNSSPTPGWETLKFGTRLVKV